MISAKKFFAQLSDNIDSENKIDIKSLCRSLLAEAEAEDEDDDEDIVVQSEFQKDLESIKNNTYNSDSRKDKQPFLDAINIAVQACDIEMFTETCAAYSYLLDEYQIGDLMRLKIFMLNK